MTACAHETISVVVPAIDEAEEIEAALTSVGSDPSVDSIVVDGGSRDDTAERARACGARVLTGPRGRALQMNRGAQDATGSILLFLHADTRLPRGWPDEVRRAIRAGAVGGRFDVVLRGRHPLLRVVAAGMNLRSRLSGISTGDQAIFVRREVFERMGGFEPIALMEDVALTRRLKREGRLAPLRVKVDTSGRRWEAHGPIRTILLMYALRLAYAVGVPPDRIARWYHDR